MIDELMADLWMDGSVPTEPAERAAFADATQRLRSETHARQQQPATGSLSKSRRPTLGDLGRDGRQLIPRGGRTGPGLAVAGSVLVVIAVVAVVLVVSGHRSNSSHVHPAPSAHLPKSSQLAVLARPQTARDRTLPAVVRRAARLGGLSKQETQSALSSIVASSMRYTQTLPDGREVFLARVHDPGVHQPDLRLLIVTPDGSRRDGDPVLESSSGLPDNRIARIQALHGGGCSTNHPSRPGGGLTVWNVEPNGVFRVIWQFPGQPGGNSLGIETLVRGNFAVATVPGLTSCQSPSSIALISKNGQLIAHTKR